MSKCIKNTFDLVVKICSINCWQQTFVGLKKQPYGTLTNQKEMKKKDLQYRAIMIFEFEDQPFELVVKQDLIQFEFHVI